jgi:hypothetical protein
MSIGLFTDKKCRPTDADVTKAIGPMQPGWNSLIQFIREQYPSEEDFAFLYGKTYGWALRFRIKGQLLTNLYPTQGGFTVQINLDSQAIETVRQWDTGDHVRQAIERATPYPEGRWLFIPVQSEEDLRDIERLLALRVETKRLLKKTGK